MGRIHKGAGQLYGDTNRERFIAVFCGGSDDGTCIVNRECRPQAKLRLGHVQHRTHRREQQQRDRVQDEDCAERYGDFFVGGVRDGRYGRDGAAAANRRADRDQERNLSAYCDHLTEKNPQQHRDYDSGGGVDEAGASGAQNLMEVHSKTEGDDRRLQEEFRECPALNDVRMREGETVEQAAEESDRR